MNTALHSPPLPIGPFDPAALETDEHMLAQARELRAFLIARADASGDTSNGHTAYCYTLKCTVEDLLHGHEVLISWRDDDINEAPALREEVNKLRRDLALAKQPLDAQMARLNQRVIELNREIETLKLAQAGSPS
jgi:hypothetical protein